MCPKYIPPTPLLAPVDPHIPHTTHLQQTTLQSSRHNCGKSLQPNNVKLWILQKIKLQQEKRPLVSIFSMCHNVSKIICCRYVNMIFQVGKHYLRRISNRMAQCHLVSALHQRDIFALKYTDQAQSTSLRTFVLKEVEMLNRISI